MTFETHHPMQPYWQLAGAAVQAQALDSALEFGVIDALQAPAEAGQLAHRLGLAADKLALLLDLLWSMGVLHKAAAEDEGSGAPRYWLTAHAGPYLLRDSPLSCALAWRYRLQALRRFASQLGDIVRDGAAPAPTAGGDGGQAAGWAQAARAQIKQEQAAVTVPAALAIIGQLPGLGQVRRFLDLGGGAGQVAIALALHYPDWQGTLFDLPETTEVARQHIEEAGLGARIAVRGGDLAHAELGRDYDLIWCSSVLHFVADVPSALKRIHAALRAGGIFVAAHAEVAAQARSAARVLPFYLPMMTQGRHVQAGGAMQRALREAGFTLVRGFESTLFPMAPVNVAVACRSER